LHIHSTQVRKDFAAIGLTGLGRVGFDVQKVCLAIRAVLGFDEQHEAVLLGTGHLGDVLLAYSGFARYGLHIKAAFETDKRRTGSTIAGYPIRSTKAMVPFIKHHKIRLAILAPPIEASAELMERLVSAGIEAFWNFTPTYLTGPAGILVRNERHFSIGLSEIVYHLEQRDPRGKKRTVP
jgi:redox-sensing transcriptional repressor